MCEENMTSVNEVDPEILPRLDLLVYCHDGRGLGHVSRSVGIGLAMRRLFPQRRVLLVSGSRFTGELIGAGGLDWIKLPAYETEVIDGRSRGVAGKSKFSDQELGLLRAADLAHLVGLYRPRLVLVDHSPQGKHRELVPALSAAPTDTKWILGVRGVVGDVKQVGTALAADLFRKYFSSLFWYGDSQILGKEIKDRLGRFYDTSVEECGYVQRLSELPQPSIIHQEPRLAGTVAVPWRGESTEHYLQCLATALERLGPETGLWKIFLDISAMGESLCQLVNRISSIPWCEIEVPGLAYLDSLRRSRMAIVYGGYNSLTDLLYFKIPALVVMREMKDLEQQIHLAVLQKATGEQFSTVSESDVSEEVLVRLLHKKLHQNQGGFEPIVKTDGAAHAATCLEKMLAGIKV